MGTLIEHLNRPGRTWPGLITLSFGGLSLTSGLAAAQDRCGSAAQILKGEVVLYAATDDLYPGAGASCSGQGLTDPEIAYRFVPEYTSTFAASAPNAFIEVREGRCGGQCPGTAGSNGLVFSAQ